MAITINAGSNVELDQPLQTTIQLDTTVSGLQYQWTLLGKPDGSTSVISAPTIKNPTFGMDVPGSYLVSLVVDSSSAVFGLCAALHPRTKVRFPAPGEGDANLGGGALAGSQGWATAREQDMRLVQNTSHRGEVEIAVSGGGSLSAGDVVSIQGISTFHATTPVAVDVPEAYLADAATLQGATNVGICLGKVDPSQYTGLSSSVAIGEICLVLKSGLYVGYDTSTYGTGDLLYVGSGGAISAAPGDFGGPIARVLVSAVSGSILMLGSASQFAAPADLRMVSASVTASKNELLGAFYSFDTSGGSLDLNLPTGDPTMEGWSFAVERNGVNSVNVNSSGGDVFSPSGATTVTLSTHGDVVEFVYDADNARWMQKYNPVSVTGATAFVVASQAEAEAGTDNTKGMTPLRTKQALDYQRPYASQAEAETGTENTKMMTPLRVAQALTANGLSLASQAEAEAGTDNTKAMTPLRTKQAIDYGYDDTTPRYFVARVRTTEPLNTTYNNGAGTLTYNVNGVFTQDGVSPLIGELVWVVEQTNTYENGLYRLTTLGDLVTPSVLTRHEDFNAGTNIHNHTLVKVAEGDRYANALYRAVVPYPFTLGTSAIIAEEATFRSRKKFKTHTGVSSIPVEEFDNYIHVWTPGSGGTDTLTLAEGDAGVDGIEVSFQRVGTNSGTLELSGSDKFQFGGGTSLALLENEVRTYTYIASSGLWMEIGYVSGP